MLNIMRNILSYFIQGQIDIKANVYVKRFSERTLIIMEEFRFENINFEHKSRDNSLLYLPVHVRTRIIIFMNNVNIFY
jgi:hypothetical protein